MPIKSITSPTSIHTVYRNLTETFTPSLEGIERYELVNSHVELTDAVARCRDYDTLAAIRDLLAKVQS